MAHHQSRFITKQGRHHRQIRYRKQANRCTVTLQPDNTLHVQLHEPLTAIAPGQAAAFYRDDVVLGGGIII